jgi:hypothetical protein
MNASIILWLLLILFVLLAFVNFFKSYKTRYHNDLTTAVKILYRQCARWALASTQDESDIIKNLHANYAMGYLMAIKDIVSCTQFKKITGQDLYTFEDRIVKVQDKAAKKLVETCQELDFSNDEILMDAVYSRG